jgi:hypothetical protein
MGRNRIVAASTVLFAAAMIAATGALSATPQDIYSDYADNGKLDNEYTPADLERVLKTATLQGYAPPTDEGLKPEVEEEIDQGNGKPAVEEEIDQPTGGGTTGGGTAGGTAGSAAGSAPPPQSSGGLPFTGLDLSLILVGALGLILLGAALRRVARQRA